MSKTYYNLYTLCSLNDFNGVQEILRESNDIDITYRNGAFFSFAIIKDNVKMLKLLIDYANKCQTDKTKLTPILNDIFKDSNLSSEMKEILYPYIDDDNISQCSIGCLSDLDSGSTIPLELIILTLGDKHN